MARGGRACWRCGEPTPQVGVSQPISLPQDTVAEPPLRYSTTSSGGTNTGSCRLAAIVHNLVQMSRKEVAAPLRAVIRLPGTEPTGSAKTTPAAELCRRAVALVWIPILQAGGVDEERGSDHGEALELLFSIERRLAGLIRHDDRLAHPVRDCFVLLADGKLGPSASGLLDRIVAGLSAPFAIAGQTIPLSIKVAVALGELTTMPEELLLLARGRLGLLDPAAAGHPLVGPGHAIDLASGETREAFSAGTAASPSPCGTRAQPWQEIDWADRDPSSHRPAEWSPRRLAAAPVRPLVPIVVLERTAELTRREWEVLDAIGRGLPTETIAEEMYVSISTVRSHVKSILAKLGVHSRLEAVALANRYGFGPDAKAEAV